MRVIPKHLPRPEPARAQAETKVHENSDLRTRGWQELRAIPADLPPSRLAACAWRHQKGPLPDISPRDVRHWNTLKTRFAALIARRDGLPGPAPTSAEVDGLKRDLVDSYNLRPSMSVAIDVAAMLGALHGKPTHSREVEAAVDALLPDHPNREELKLSARLVILGEWEVPNDIMRGGRLSPEARQRYIAPINDRSAALVRKIPGTRASAVADAIDGANRNDLSALMHSVRDIAAMDAPRQWRADRFPPDGRVPPEQIIRELRENATRPGRDATMTENVIARFKLLKGLPTN